MTRTHAAAWALSIAIVAVILTLAGCAPSRPPFCPPPFGCEK